MSAFAGCGHWAVHPFGSELPEADISHAY